MRMKKITFLFTIIISSLPGILFADTFTIPFSNSANYTYPNEVEVNGGLAKLKDTPIGNGLKGYWRMEDTSGQVIDSSGNGNNLTNHGASYGAPGKLNNALSFAEGDYLDGGGNMMNMGLDDMSISAWFKTTDNNGIIVAKSFYSAQDERYALYFGGGYFRAFIDYGGEKRVNTPASPYLDNQWHHAVVTYDRDGLMKLYVDGGEKDSIDISASDGIDFDKNNLFLIGRYNDGSGNTVHPSALKFSGSIDDVAIWNRVLTPAEITELYNAGNGKEVTKYSNGTFSIWKTSGDSANHITQFTNFQVTPGTLEGSLSFQLSTDGTNWKYWDGSAWVAVSNNNDTNTESEVQSHISTFPTSSDSIYVKTFLAGDGMQRVEVDEIKIDYNVNNAPTDIKMNGSDALTIQEGTASGTSIATLTTTDADTGDTHTYSLVNGTGDEDNTKFTITGDQLKLNFVPDYENPSDLGDTQGNNTYSIRIQTDDGNGGTYQKSFIITVSDVDENAPVISLLGSPVVTIYQGDTYTDAGATALDDVDGDITSSIVVTNPVDTNVIGDYTLRYNVTDSAGNPAQEVTRLVHVIAVPASISQQNTHHHRRSRRISRARLAEIFGWKKVSEKIVKRERVEALGYTNNDEKCNLASINSIIRFGDKGEDVKKIQVCLNSIGIDAGPEDGIFGSLTENAVLQFQRDYHLRFVDGIVGKETIRALSQGKKENA